MWARPPMIIRRPRKAPLSRAIGARPASAAMRRRSSRPRSGRSAMSVPAVTGPMPGTERSRSSVSRQTGGRPDEGGEVVIEAAQGLLEPGDVGLEVALQAAIAQEPAPVVLGAEHVDELAAPGDEFAQRGGLRIGH